MWVRPEFPGVAFAVVVTAACAAGSVQASAASALPRSGVLAGTAPSLVQPVKECRRVPIWGWRISPFCKPSGVCNDRVIKGYKTVCS